MNAMLEPRIVAVRIQGLVLSPHGTSLPPDRSTASSQGALMETMDAFQATSGPKIDPAKARAHDFLTSLLRNYGLGRLTQSPWFVTTCSAGLTCFLRISSSRNKSVSSARR